MSIVSSVLRTAAALTILLAACDEVVPKLIEPSEAGPIEVDAGVDADGGGDAEPPPVPKGARTLGIGLDMGDMDSYPNLQYARDAGATTTTLHFAWDDVERPVDGGGTVISAIEVHVANLYLQDQSTSATIAASALDYGGSRLPADLASLPLDDASVAARYAKVLDYLLDQLHDTTIDALLVATEVDVALGTDAQKWSAFGSFVKSAADHAEIARPGTRVGFGVTSDAFPSKQALASAAGGAVLGVTYVPVDAAAKVRPVSAADADFARVVAAAPAGRPLVFYEVGYPSSPACGADEAAQAAFVKAVFRAWDANASKIPTLTFISLEETPADVAAAQAARAGHAGDAAFLGLFSTLGMRTQNGRDKPSLPAFLDAARARGWKGPKS
jgi:hypothetical protein